MKKTAMLLILCLMTGIFAGGVPSAAEPVTPAAKNYKVDLDLSKLSGTVVFSQVYNMMADPEPYLGMVIRMAGYYSSYEDTEKDAVYHACIIPDASACCSQGIEFVWKGEHAWPDEYPAEGTDIVVTGRLETYEEDGYTYLHLMDAELVYEVNS